MEFETINTLKDIEDLMTKASSDDGEALNFELKGSQGETKFKKDHKKLLAKEICAFANTYGGILCFHFGGDTNIEKFPSGIASSNFNSIEGWLRDSLEPKHLGMDLKIADDIILINIPESKTKPHRTVSTSEYYYRHVTISQKMPEIMISSMYRSQDYLNFNSLISVSKSGSQLNFSIHIQNHSNISGTKPKIQVQLFGKFGSLIQFGTNPYFDKFSRDSFQTSPQISELNIPFCGMLETNSDFAERILYPLDKITLINFSIPDENIKDLKYILVRMDCMFKESQRQTEHRIIKFHEGITSEVHMSSKDSNEIAIFHAFKKLIE